MVYRLVQSWICGSETEMASSTLGQILYPSSTSEDSSMSPYKDAGDGSAAVSTTRHFQQYHGSGDATVAPLITLLILIAGVLGGLFIVVCVILFCKYCVKTKKSIRRHTGYSAEMKERPFWPLQRYETINSDVFSEPSSASVDIGPVSPRRPFDLNKSHDRLSESEEPDETTQLRTDFDKAQLKSEDSEFDECKVESEDTGGSVESRTKKVVSEESEVLVGIRARGIASEEAEVFVGSRARRVSFQVDKSSSTPCAADNKLRRCRRYTEGDFHHLKRSKISTVPRQHSVGATHTSSQPWPLSEVFNERRAYDETKNELISMVELDSSPSPTLKPIKTQVAAEIHQEDISNTGEKTLEMRPLPPQTLRMTSFQNYSHSLEIVSPTAKKMHSETRKVKSYDDMADYDVLKITEFSKGPFYNTDYDVISELGSPISSKVRYNDTGSLEQLNEEQVVYLNDLDLDGIMPEESDDTETLNGTQKYRELWNLRATLEDEDECSDTIRMEDMTSPEDSPDREQVTPYTTSFESNTEAVSEVPVGDHRDNGIHWEGNASSKNLLHPNYENRRKDYRNILSKKLQKSGPNTSTENSFDSVETDGDVSDTSRYELTTTSFESTTDNTDSTTESQQSKLRQMKADSGYKSLETQNSTKDQTEGEAALGAHFHNRSPQRSPPKSPNKSKQKSPQRQSIAESNGNASERSKNGQKRSGHTSHFDRRNGKSASKKRRAYSRERQMVRVYESINEPETDSKSELASGDSFEENAVPSKISVFKRFFKSYSLESRERYLMRDYSIDETTNKIFNDFIRQEPHERSTVRRSPRLHPRHRLHRKHTEPVVGERRNRDQLAPNMRSASLGSDSSASSVRRLSPQDSIEEAEYEEQEQQHVQQEQEQEEQQSVCWAERPHKSHIASSPLSSAVHEIPIIKLPEEDPADS